MEKRLKRLSWSGEVARLCDVYLAAKIASFVLNWLESAAGSAHIYVNPEPDWLVGVLVQ